jgi:regulator of sirC expression with transglutaminase-like and TPR domain
MDLTAALERLAKEPEAPLDMAAIALQLAKEEYPEIEVALYLKQLDLWAEALGPGLEDCTLEEQYERLVTLLFEEVGFTGNTEDYYDSRNSYLNQVIDRRSGLPITLTLVAMAVGSRAGLKVVGIGLPGHFIAQLHDGFGSILFDPFHGGKRLRVADCTELVEKATGQPVLLTPMHFDPVSPHGLLVRLLNNLRGVYLGQRDFSRAVRVLERMRQLQPDHLPHLRDLGICHVQLGQPGLAVQELSVYLKQEPADAAALRPLLAQARQDQAARN